MVYVQVNKNKNVQDWYNKQRVVFDVECYINYFLIVVYDYNSRKMLGYWCMHNDVRNHTDPSAIVTFLADKHLISFNGVNYDELMIDAFSKGATNAQLKYLSDSIINGVNGVKLQRYQYPSNLPEYLHTDLINSSFGSASLKVYGARLKLRKLEELPLEPSAIILDEHLKLMLKYCINDCYVTAELFEYMLPALELRVSIGIEYGVGLLFVNKSDAQIGNACVKIDVERLTKVKFKKPNLKNYPLSFKYTAPPFIKFQTNYLNNDVLELAESLEFKINPKTKKVISHPEFKGVVELRNKKYQIAIGGIHSKNDRGSFYENDNYMILMFDVGSMYPNVIQNGKFHPRNVNYLVWKTLYQNLIDKKVGASVKLKAVNSELSDIDAELKSLGYEG